MNYYKSSLQSGILANVIHSSLLPIYMIKFHINWIVIPIKRLKQNNGVWVKVHYEVYWVLPFKVLQDMLANDLCNLIA